MHERFVIQINDSMFWTKFQTNIFSLIIAILFAFVLPIQSINQLCEREHFIRPMKAISAEFLPSKLTGQK